MLAQGITYERVAWAAEAFRLVCDADGVDDIELAQAVIDSGRRENKIEPFDGPIRRNMIATGSATPATLAILDLGLEMCDAETFLCFVVLKARGR